MRFGVELEFTAATVHAHHPSRGSFFNFVIQLMRECGINEWRLDNDASCGNELVSPILEGENGLAQTLQVCHCVQAAQDVFGLPRVLGPDAGVHFHFDATDLADICKDNVRALRNVLIMSAILEPLWYSMNPSARFETAFAAPLNFNLFQITRARDIIDLRNEWFRPYMGVNGHSDSYRVKHTDYSPVFINSDMRPEKYDWTRYHGMNLIAFFKHKTIEFRYTHGSFDEFNVETWFNHYLSVVKAARELPTKKILRACPINIEDMKMNNMNSLQDIMYRNLKAPIKFLFDLIGKDAKMLHFILYKIIKYSPQCLEREIVKRILEYEGDSFDELWSLTEDYSISSSHRRHNRMKFVPQPGYVNEEPAYPEEDYADDYRD